MGLIEDNIIPGNHGKIFTIDVEDEFEFAEVQERVMEIPGVKDVVLDQEEYPHEMVIHTHDMVKVSDVQAAVKDTGYHAVPKGLFPLF